MTIGTSDGPIVPGFWELAAGPSATERFVTCGSDTRTYAALGADANRIADWLRGEGLADGEVIAVCSTNCVDYLAVLLGAEQVGTTVVPVNAHLGAAEVAHILRDSGASLVVAHDDRAATVSSLDDATDGQAVVHVVTIGEGHGPGSLHDAMRNCPASPPSDRRAGNTQFYTSGTSGRPKGVVAPPATGTPEEVLVARSLSALTRFGIDPRQEIGDGAHLHAAPMYHTAPMSHSLLALHLGHDLVVMPRFDAAGWLDLVGRHSITWAMLVPTMMKRLLDVPGSPSADISSLRWLIHAGSRCPEVVKRATIEWLGPIVYEYYASTEGGGTAITTAEWLKRPGSVGRPWTGADVRILDDERLPVPSGEVGTIFFRNNRGLRYHNDDDKTAAATHDGYITAGDLGSIDEEGFLFVADRRNDLIVSGGVNVYPAEVEAVLLAHPRVADAAVVGVADDEWGQRVIAFVELADDGADNPAHTIADELDTYCRDRMAGFKRPREARVVDALPRNEAGKVLRRSLREQVPTIRG